MLPLALFLLSAAAAAAQPADLAPPILEREQRLAQALQANDRPALEAILAPDYVLRGYPDIPRERWIANAIDLCWGKTFELSEFAAKQDGETIVASFIFTFDQDPATCQPAVLRSLITDVWTRREDGEWRLALRHSSAATRPGESVAQQFATVPEPPPVWQIASELSFVATGGNTDTQTIGTTTNLQHDQGPWETTARGAFVRSSAGGVESARSLLLEARPGYDVTPRLTFFGRTGFRRDLFAGIDARWAFGLGLAYEVLTGPAHTLRVEGGAGYDREKRISAPVLRNASAQTRAAYRWRFSPLFSVDVEGSASADPVDAANWRGSNKASATVAINRALSLKVSHSLEYVNEPVPGFRQTDTLTSIGLVIDFRR